MPAAIVAAVEIAFLAEALYLLLYSRTVDRQIVRHLGEGDEGLVAQERKQATAIPAPEVDPLTVVPPGVLVGIPHDVYLALHLLAHRLAEEGKEGSNFAYGGVSTVGGHFAYFLVSTMQGLKVFSLFAVADDNHGPPVTGHNVVHHQAGDTSVASLYF